MTKTEREYALMIGPRLMDEERSWAHPLTNPDASTETGEAGLLTNSTQCDASAYATKPFALRLQRGFNILKGDE